MAKDWVTKDTDPALTAELKGNTPKTKQSTNRTSTRGSTGFELAIWFGVVGILCLIGLLWAMKADYS